MNLAPLLQRAAKLAADNSPAILTTIGVVGAVTTAYLAGKASFEAADIIRLKEADDEERGVPQGDPREILKDRVELVWQLYIPAAVTCTATVACIIAANRVGARRAAGLAAAYSIAERTAEEYKAKVVEKLGERKADEIETEVLQERVQRAAEPEDVDLIDVADGVLCFDAFSARYFKSTVEEIRAAINTINNRLNHDGYACLGDLYRILDIPPTAYSDLIGWNSDRLIEENIHSVLDKRDKPIVVMDFRNQPGPDYSRFH